MEHLLLSPLCWCDQNCIGHVTKRGLKRPLPNSPPGKSFLDFMRFQEGKQSSNSRDEFLRLFSTQAFKERHQDSHSHPSTASWTHLLLWRQPSSICFLYMRHEKHYTKQPLFPLAQTNLRVNSEDFWGLSLLYRKGKNRDGWMKPLLSPQKRMHFWAVFCHLMRFIFTQYW